mgnify:CR=1 FL=1
MHNYSPVRGMYREDTKNCGIYPPEVALEHGIINAEALADSKEFIEEFKVDYSKFPSNCPYKVCICIIDLEKNGDQ